MSNQELESSPKNTHEHEVIAAEHDTHSVDSSDDLGSSSGSSSSGSRSATTGTESVVSIKPAVVTSAIAVLSESGSDGSGSDRSSSESGSEEVSDEEGASSDPNTTFKSALDADVSVEPTTTRSSKESTPGTAVSSKVDPLSPAASTKGVGAVSHAIALASPVIATPCKGISFEEGRTPKTVRSKSSSTVPLTTAPPPVVVTAPAIPLGQATAPVAPTAPVAAEQQLIEPSVLDAKPTATRVGKRKSSTKTSSDQITQQPPRKAQREERTADASSQERKNHVERKERKERRKRSKKKAKDKAKEPSEPVGTDARIKSTEVKRSGKSKRAKSPVNLAPAVGSHSPNERTPSPEPEQPGPSSRIAKISDGRRFQKIAMSRAKNFGGIKDGSIQTREVSEALKRVRNTKFNIQATHAYRHYNRVHGTDLPHVRKHLEGICERYGTVLGATAECELTLARDQDNDRRMMIVPQDESPYFPIWQFDNELHRAVPSPSYQMTSENEASTSTEAVAVDFKDISAVQAAPARSVASADAMARPAEEFVEGMPSKEAGKSPKKRKRNKRKV